MEWDKFPEGENPGVLTGISEPCNNGKHDDCPGFAPSEDHGGQAVFCMCQCHKVPLEDLPAELREPVPSLDGWEAYCEECAAFREVRRADERDAKNGTPYSEFICTACHSILLTFQRLGTQRAEDKPAEPLGTTARCPHCGELNVFPRMTQILVYVCQHCGQGVDATPRVQ